jgi:hypothetical protein
VQARTFSPFGAQIHRVVLSPKSWLKQPCAGGSGSLAASFPDRAFSHAMRMGWQPLCGAICPSIPQPCSTTFRKTYSQVDVPDAGSSN